MATVPRVDVRPIESRPFKFTTPTLTRGYLPARGLPFSILAHGIVVLLIVILSALPSAPAPWQTEPQAKEKKRDHLVTVMWLPRLGGGASVLKALTKLKAAPAAPQLAPAAGREGLVYPGPQQIISDVPSPTNNIQTLLQPGLKNPPVLEPPIALPNIVQIANAGPAPLVRPQELAVSPPEPVNPKPAEPPRPAQPAETKQTEATPLKPPAAPELEPEPLRAETPPLPEPPRHELRVPARVEPPRPMLVDALKLDVPAPLPSPKTGRPDMVIEPPAPPSPPIENAGKVSQPTEPPSAQTTKSEPAQGTPSGASQTLAATQTPPGQQGEASQARADEPKGPPPVEWAAVPTAGNDQRNLVALSPMPTVTEQTPIIPAGEARGRFAVSPEPNVSTSGPEPGSPGKRVSPNTGGSKALVAGNAGGNAPPSSVTISFGGTGTVKNGGPASGGSNVTGGSGAARVGASSAGPGSGSWLWSRGGIGVGSGQRSLRGYHDYWWRR